MHDSGLASPLMCAPLILAAKYVTAYEAGDTKSMNLLLIPYPFFLNSRSHISGISTDLDNNIFVRKSFIDIPKEPSAWQILLLLLSIIYTFF